MECREHAKADMLTQVCQTAYVPGAECPQWGRFMEEVLPDPAVRRFLHLFFGSCLTGDTGAQLMPILWGTGANGKSTMVETLLSVLGEDYSMKAKRNLLMVARNTEHPTSVARLYRKRLVVCVESSEDGRLDETLVKELTGGDRIAARFMRQDEWEFSPTHKVVLVTNHKPEVRGTDDAIWRRLPLVEFGMRFQPGDPSLKERLLTEASGILNWMIAGCEAWLADGKRFELPQAVRHATAEYRAQEDCVGSFLAERCVRDDAKKCAVRQFQDALSVWCAVNRRRQPTGRTLTESLALHGVYKDDSKQHFLKVDVK